MDGALTVWFDGISCWMVGNTKDKGSNVGLWMVGWIG